MKLGMIWRCPHCGDEMNRKFRRSHQQLCVLISELLEDSVEDIEFYLGRDE